MYYSKIEAAAVVDQRTQTAIDAVPDTKATLLGLFLLLIALPLLATRMFAWAVARDIRRIGKVGGIVGLSFAEAMRRK